MICYGVLGCYGGFGGLYFGFCFDFAWICCDRMAGDALWRLYVYCGFNRRNFGLFTAGYFEFYDPLRVGACGVLVGFRSVTLVWWL